MSDPIVMIGAAILVVVASVFLLTLRIEIRFYVLAFLAVPQFFVSGLSLSIFESICLLLLILSMFDRRLRVRQLSLTVPAVGLSALSFAYTAFSVDVNAGIITGLRWLVFLCVLRYVWAIRKSPTTLNRGIMLTLPWIVLEAVLTVIFRIRPDVENSFLRSPLAEFLIGPTAARLFTTAANNVLDPQKSGGLFINANVASMFLGVSASLVAVLAYRTRRKWIGFLASIIGLSVIATGSKTGLTLLLILPIVALLLPRISRGLFRVMLVPLSIGVIIVCALVPQLIAQVFPSFADSSASSLGTRGILWDFASTAFARSPLLGLGFGGYQASLVEQTGIDYPPHNLVIAAWANTGLLAAILTILFILAVVFVGIKRIFSEDDLRQRKAVSAAVCGLLWIFVHGQADNTVLFGESRTMMLAVILLAVVYPLSTGNSPNAGASGRSQRIGDPGYSNNTHFSPV